MEMERNLKCGKPSFMVTKKIDSFLTETLLEASKNKKVYAKLIQLLDDR